MRCRINVLWDKEAGVWVATSQNVPGLVLESGSFDALLERVKYAVPELIELNGVQPEYLKLTYISEREDRVPAKTATCLGGTGMTRGEDGTWRNIHGL